MIRQHIGNKTYVNQNLMKHLVFIDAFCVKTSIRMYICKCNNYDVKYMHMVIKCSCRTTKLIINLQKCNVYVTFKANILYKLVQS